MVLMAGTFSSFGVFFKPMLTDLVWTRAETSGAFSLAWIVQGLGTIVAGRLTDRLGPRIVVTVCALFLGLGYLLMSQISTLWQLYLFYGLVVGVGTSGTFVPFTSMIARWFVKRRGVMTGIAVAGMGVGILIVPIVAAWLISLYEWRMSYIILGSAALIAVVLVAQLLRRDPTQVGQTAYGEDEEETRLKGSTELFSLKRAVSTRQFWLFFSMVLCLGFSMQAIVAHIVPHATDLEISANGAANILATVGGASVIGRFVSGIAGDRMGSRQVFIIGFPLMAVALFWLLQATELWALYLFAAIYGFALGGCLTSQSPFVAELFGLSSHGLILGFISFGFCVGSAIGPFVGGYVFDVSNSYQIAFVACGAISILGLILVLLLKPFE